MTTELETLKIKKRMKKATSEDLARLKVLQDGEPLSVADLAEAKRREEERTAQDKKDYEAKQRAKSVAHLKDHPAFEGPVLEPEESLDVPADHPRIAKLKEALLPFTKIEAHVSRPDDFVLFSRGVSITAGDVRIACKAMTL